MAKIFKPWGFERIIHNSKKYLFKELFMKKGHQCSLQYHNYKYETVYVIKGKLLVILKKNNRYINKILIKGDNLTIDKKVIHRMKALSDCTYLEASTAHPKDVVRIEDDYARV